MPIRSAAISLSRAVSRSASRRELANTIVDFCCSMRSTIRSSTCGQIDVRLGSPAAGPSRSSVTEPISVMSSIGTTTVRSQRFSLGGATTSTGLGPPRNRATSSTGRTVAESPMRWAGAASSSSSRSSDSARCAPRLVPATAWTSSRMTVSTPRSESRAWEVSIRKSDSGVVIRMSGGVVASLRRSAGEVSPERTPTVTSGTGMPSRSDGLPDADQGSPQVALDVDGESLERRDVENAAAAPLVVWAEAWCASRSSAQRKAASVLPDPVGATTSA